MAHATFSLDLSNDEVLLFYRAQKNRVHVTTDDGTVLSLPWEILQPHVNKDGVSGNFVITFDGHGKLGELRRI